MQVRFLCDADFSVMVDGHEKITHVAIGDIYPCLKIVYDDPERKWGDIYFTETRVILDVNGSLFEPVGPEVEFKNDQN